MEQKTLTKRNTIKQSHELNRASYKLGSLATDIIFVMISELKKEDKDFNLYEIKIRDLELKLGKRIDIKYLKKAVKDVMSNPIGLKSSDGSFTYLSWVSIFKFNATERKIYFRFDSELRPLLLEIQQNFVLSQLKEISQLQSEYAKRIYNIAKQWETKGTFKIKIETLQEILQVPKSLLTYSNFKLKVLLLSIEQINKYTTINLKLREIKEGRRVNEVILNILKEGPQIKETIQEERNKSGVNAVDSWLSN